MFDVRTVIMMAIAGLIGLFGLLIASRANDLGISIFGMALGGFAVVYIFTMIKRGYDRA